MEREKVTSLEMSTANRMDYIPFSKIRKVLEKVLQRERDGEPIIHLEVGLPDFDTPQHIKDACIEAMNRGEVNYTSNYGLLELRQAISFKLNAANGISYCPDNEIIVTSGVTEAIYMSMMALINPGDEVLVMMPAFPAYHAAIKMAGGVPVEVHLDEKNAFMPDSDAVKAKITSKTRMMIVNSPCNPTGAVYNRTSLEGLAKLAVAHNLFVISDEIYEEMIYGDAEHISMASLPGMFPRTLTLNGFSKSYAMTGWRIGYVAAPEKLTRALLKVRQYITVCSTSFAQWGALDALIGDQTCVADMVSAFNRRRKLVYSALSSMPALTINEPLGAFYAFPNVSQLSESPMELAEYLLDEAKIALVPWGENHLRISYANSYDNLEIAMNRLNEALERL